MKVPACPIPIHQTKFVIANPYPIGMFIPQMPTPFMSSQPIAKLSNIRRRNAIANPLSQPRDVFRVRTTSVIFVVTDALS